MKVGPLSIILIGVMVAAIALSFGFFHHYKPNTEEAKLWLDYRDNLVQEHQKGKQAVRRVEEAKRLRTQIANQWRAIVAEKTPPDNFEQGGVNLGMNHWELVNHIHKFRNNVQVAVNQQVKAGGVTVVNGPNIPNPPVEPNAILGTYFNFPAIPFPVAIFDLGTVTVRGTYEQIEAHLAAWSDMPRYMAVTDRLALNGTSPNLTATYNLTIVAYVRSKRIYPQYGGGVIVPAGAGGGQGQGGQGQGGQAGQGGQGGQGAQPRPAGAPGGGGPPGGGFPGAPAGRGGPPVR